MVVVVKESGSESEGSCSEGEEGDPQPDTVSDTGSVVEHASVDGGGGGGSVAASERSAAPLPLPVPDLFDAVAEEWQRLRLAMQDVY